MRGEYLFSKVDMFSVIEHQKQQAGKRVQAIGSDQLQRATEDEIINQIVSEYRLDVPVIKDDKIYVAEHGESQVNTSRDFRQHIRARSRPSSVVGMKTTIAVPFKGDPELLKVQPSTYTSSRPSGEIIGNEIHLTYIQAEPNAEAIKLDYMKTVQEIKQYLDWQRPSADEFNNQLESLVRQRVSDRRKKLLASTGMLELLGLPIKNQEE